MSKIMPFYPMGLRMNSDGKENYIYMFLYNHDILFIVDAVF